MTTLKIKFCSCKACRAGRHRKGSHAITKSILRGARRRWNLLARQGRDEEISPVSAGYTD